MEFKQIQTKRIYEMVAEQIEDMIHSNKLKQGDQLDSVEQLAKKFNVSRSTIREALSALKAKGFIEVKQGEGTFVKSKNTPFQSTIILPEKMDQKTLLEILDVRKIIESNAAAIAASKRTDSDLQKIKESLDQMENNGELGIEADVKFHLAIADATHNFVLVQMMNQVSEALYSMIHTGRQSWLSEPSTVYRLFQEHLSIYKAIAEQNATLAQQLMLAHLVKVEQTLTKQNSPN